MVAAEPAPRAGRWAARPRQLPSRAALLEGRAPRAGPSPHACPRAPSGRWRGRGNRGAWSA
eukprot:5439120-Pyramimonas_sp.AAC.1